MPSESKASKFSICIYLDNHDAVSIRNINYLSKQLEATSKPIFEVVVIYTHNIDIAQFSRLYPNIRYHRMLKKPANHFFLFHYFAQKIRSKILVFVSNQILLNIRDTLILANDTLKPNVLLSYLDNSKYLFLPSHQKSHNLLNRFNDKFGYFLNRSRSELYSRWNSLMRVSSLELFAINLESFVETLNRISIQDKFYFFRGRFVINTYHARKSKAYFDLSICLLTFRSNMIAHSPGRASSRWLIPTSANFFPMFMFYKQIMILIKLMTHTGYIPKIINYKQIFLFVSHITLLFFFMMSSTGYENSWLLLMFFIFLNLPLLFEGNRSLFKLYPIFKLFLLLL